MTEYSVKTSEKPNLQCEVCWEKVTRLTKNFRKYPDHCNESGWSWQEFWECDECWKLSDEDAYQKLNTRIWTKVAFVELDREEDEIDELMEKAIREKKKGRRYSGKYKGRGKFEEKDY